jgi:Flp pilus assembly pilin Flp
MMVPSEILKAVVLVLSARIKRCWQGDQGQTMVEYVMLIVLVALAVFLLTPNLQSAIITVFSNTSSALATGSGS